jgi:GR25 family glycosyltransferase involved in LPS biosynthesis
MDALDQKFQRFSAIKHSNGGVGCMKSHIRCLEMAIEQELPYVVIMEDDCEFLINKEKVKLYIDEFLKTDSPCFIFGGTFVKSEAYNDIFQRGKYVKSTTCYIVKNYYIKTLLDLWKKYVILLENTGKYNEYACDIIWTQLQEKDIWLIPNNIRAIQQKPGYSDIEKKFVDYREYFKPAGV